MKKVDHIKIILDEDGNENGAVVVFTDGTKETVSTDFVLTEFK